eukprot:3782420-Prymnesium_polylepis.1
MMASRRITMASGNHYFQGEINYFEGILDKNRARTPNRCATAWATGFGSRSHPGPHIPSELINAQAPPDPRPTRARTRRHRHGRYCPVREWTRSSSEHGGAWRLAFAHAVIGTLELCLLITYAGSDLAVRLSPYLGAHLSQHSTIPHVKDTPRQNMRESSAATRMGRRCAG